MDQRVRSILLFDIVCYSGSTSQKTPHTLLSQASYGVFVVNILDETDYVVMGANYIMFIFCYLAMPVAILPVSWKQISVGGHSIAVDGSPAGTVYNVWLGGNHTHSGKSSYGFS